MRLSIVREAINYLSQEKIIVFPVPCPKNVENLIFLLTLAIQYSEYTVYYTAPL
jgi:hypothetical protein